jgi:hypothetical protein
MDKTSSGRKCKNSVKSFTKGKERKKWDLRDTCNDTNHRNTVPTEDEFVIRTRKDIHDVKEYGL